MSHLFFMALYLSNPQAADPKSDQAKVRALVSEARGEAKATGCTQVAQCKAMPVGNRSCGGPSDFIVYCAASTDEAKLTQKAKAATEAETAYNQKHGVASICAVLGPPKLILTAGACAAAAAKSMDVPM